MKKKFSRILGVVAAVALLASFMVPVAADVSQPLVTLDDETISATTEYSVSFNIGEELWTSVVDASDLQTGGHASTTAEWSIAQKHSGSDSVKLHAGFAASDWAEVLLTPPAGITLDDMATITSGWSWWYYIASAAGNRGTSLELYFQGPGGTFAEMTIMDDAYGATTTLPIGVWTKQTVDSTTTGVVFGDDGATIPQFPTSGQPEQSIAAMVNYITTWEPTAGDWVLTEVRPALGWIGAAQTIAYIDDVTIGTRVYDLERVTTPATITITFPEDTGVPVSSTAGTIQAAPGWISGQWENSTTTGVTFLSNDEELTVIATLGDGDQIGEGAMVRIQIPSIQNPDEAGDYTLEVETSEEDDLVESETYTIEVPDVDVLPGIVELYNPSDVLMDSDTGPDALQNMLNDAEEDWVIKIGEGLYAEDATTDCADITIEGSGDVEDIIIEGTFTIAHEDITIDGITLDGDGAVEVLVVNVGANDFTIENCVLEDADVALILVDGGIEDEPTVIDNCTFNIEDETGIVTLGGTFTEVSDSTFTIEEDGEGIAIDIRGGDIEVTDCTFNGGSGVGVEVNGGDSAIEGCTFDGLLTAFVIIDGTVDIFGGTIQNCEEEAITVEDAVLVTIHNNTITGNDEAVILFVEDDADFVFMMFNTITDNAGDDDLLIDNNDDDEALYVINNWWGDADGPGDDAFSGDVESEPFLPGPIENSALATAVGIGATADFEDEAGVTVSSTEGDGMDIVGAAQYTTNPVDAIDDAVGYWDICVMDTDDDAPTSVTIRFYIDVTEDTEVYVWGEARGEWLQCDPDDAVPNLFSGFIAVDVGATTTPTLDDLAALPFVVVEPPEGTADAVEISAPEVGAVDVSVTPTLAWSAEDDATYEIQIAQDATFGILDEAATSPTNAYIVTTALAEGQSYYWRVRAVTDAGAGDWATGVFTTATPEPEKEPPITITEAPGAPEITVTIPAATVTQAIAPGLLWAIIGVGAVLVIALIVLIVRTRRAV